MSWPAIKFVATPDVGATVRLDMSQDRIAWVAHDGFSLGAPTFAGEPGATGVNLGYRQLQFTVIFEGTKAVALANLALLARELMRAENYVLFQLESGSTPVWYHTYQSAPGELSLENVYDSSTGVAREDMWQFSITLDADGLGMGAIETVVTNVNITLDPATGGTNPCQYTVGATIKGDAATPAVVNFSWEVARHGYRHLLAVTRTTSYVWQVGGADGWTAGTDTGASTAGATFSGGTYRPVTFATVATMATRLSGVAPAAVANGKYRILVRVARSTTAAKFAFRFGVKVVFNYTYGPTVNAEWGTSTAATHAAWVDLGIYNLPLATPQTGTNTPDIALDVQRVSGTGEARIDCFKLIPVTTDSTTMYVDHPDLGPGGTFLFREIHDSETETFYQRDATGPLSSQTAVPAGAWPTLVPGTANVVHVLSQTSPTLANNFWGDAPDRIADDVQMTLTYRPRYLAIPA